MKIASSTANQFSADPSQQRAYDHVWDYRFRNKCNDSEQQALRCITEDPDRDWFEEQKFPEVHKIIFGRSTKPLLEELAQNPNAVVSKDAQGRTALDWATARAQLEDMRTLVHHRSDVDTMDNTGRTPVTHAVDSHNLEALETILELGASPNPKVPQHLFRSSPVTSASLGGLTEMVKLLISYGAEIDAANPEGRTALQSVAMTQNVDCAGILLKAGANMDHMSSNGRTPLVTTIIHNSHAVLKLFLSECACRLEGREVLNTIAEHADAETMLILKTFAYLEVDLEDIEDSRVKLSLRDDFNNTLNAAFSDLAFANYVLYGPMPDYGWSPTEALDTFQY